MFAYVTGRRWLFWVEPANMIFRSVNVGAPFLVLAVLATISGYWERSVEASHDQRPRRARSWMMAAFAGLGLTLALWGLYYYEGYTYSLGPRTGGANIGLGLLMLASPLLVGLAMWVVGHVVTARWSSRAR